MVFFEMCFQDFFSSVFLFTKFTLKRLFSECVHFETFDMSLKIRFTIEFHITYFTLERLISSVNFEMGLETTFQSEFLLTVFALPIIIANIFNLVTFVNFKMFVQIYFFVKFCVLPDAFL